MAGIYRGESKVGYGVRDPHQQRQWRKSQLGYDDAGINPAVHRKNTSDPYSRSNPGIGDMRCIPHQGPGFSSAALAAESRINYSLFNYFSIIVYTPRFF